MSSDRSSNRIALRLILLVIAFVPWAIPAYTATHQWPHEAAEGMSSGLNVVIGAILVAAFWSMCGVYLAIRERRVWWWSAVLFLSFNSFSLGILTFRLL